MRTLVFSLSLCSRQGETILLDETDNNTWVVFCLGDTLTVRLTCAINTG